MIVELNGIIERIGEEQVFDTFRKKEIVIKVPDGDYSNNYGIEFANDNISKLDQYKPGEQVIISAGLNGRDWESPKDGKIKNFLSLRGFKIDYAGDHADQIQGNELNKQIVDNAHDLSDPENDMPF